MRKKRPDLSSASLFLHPRFLASQGPFIWLEAAGVRIPVFGDKEWKSPLRAPFGGFEFLKGAGRLHCIELLSEIDRRAASEGISSLEIQLPPESYFLSDHPWLPGLLEEQGYKLLYSDTSFHLPLDNSFSSHLHRSERWKLHKAERLGFTFRSVAEPDWEILHAFILASRQRRGYSLSMTAVELAESSQAFPGRYRVWEVLSAAGQKAAMALSVHISENIEYIFYTADDPAFRFVSPVVMLHRGLFDAMKSEGKALLDLGTASLTGNLNKGVADFKRFLGGVESRKCRVFKQWF